MRAPIVEPPALLDAVDQSPAGRRRLTAKNRRAAVIRHPSATIRRPATTTTAIPDTVAIVTSSRHEINRGSLDFVSNRHRRHIDSSDTDASSVAASHRSTRRHHAVASTRRAAAVDESPADRRERNKQSTPIVAAVPSFHSSSARKPATIRLENFDGSNQPIETHLAKLDNLTAYYGWDDTDRLCHLRASLTGSAACLLWELSPSCSASELIQLLRARFGSEQQTERFRFELRSRR